MESKNALPEPPSYLTPSRLWSKIRLGEVPLLDECRKKGIYFTILGNMDNVDEAFHRINTVLINKIRAGKREQGKLDDEDWSEDNYDGHRKVHLALVVTSTEAGVQFSQDLDLAFSGDIRLPFKRSEDGFVLHFDEVNIDLNIYSYIHAGTVPNRIIMDPETLLLPHHGRSTRMNESMPLMALTYGEPQAQILQAKKQRNTCCCRRLELNVDGRSQEIIIAMSMFGTWPKLELGERFGCECDR